MHSTHENRKMREEVQCATYMINGETNSETFHAEFSLGTSVLLHECDNNGAFGIFIILVWALQFDNVLWVVRKSF